MGWKQFASVAYLSGAALLLESTLTRLLAISQFYHFAFLAVSLALLGFGASGSILTVWLRRENRARQPQAEVSFRNRLLALSGVAFALSVGVAYGIVNLLPFDSFTIAWDSRQILYFGLYYLALALPFICAGLGIGGALAATTSVGHLIYGANLLGSSAGVLASPLVLAFAGVPGSALLSAGAGLVAALLAGHPLPRGQRWALLSMTGLALLSILALGRANSSDRAPLGLALSPYKGLSHAWRVPGTVRLFGRWSAISRVDGVAGAGTHQMPGLSYTFPGRLPEQLGLSVDGNALWPVSQAAPQAFEAIGYLPEAIAFRLRPAAVALILEPGGGLSLQQALAGGAQRVDAVSGDALIAQATARISPKFNGYEQPGVLAIHEMPRVYLQRSQEQYDVVFFPLTDAYQPVTNGAFSLSETYTLTVQAFEAALDRLTPDGILVATRWLQTPPSEETRLAATLIEALARRGSESPGNALAAFRGIQTMTFLVKPAGWNQDELAAMRAFIEDRRFDAVWLPDIRAEEVNRYNILPEPAYFRALRELLEASDRAVIYHQFPFLISPATDDRPFFYHFFKWEQTPALLAAFGHTWQPFGGSGYFVLLALLALVICLSAGLIFAPLLAGNRNAAAIMNLRPAKQGSRARLAWRVPVYFLCLGVAFLFVEIPLIQRWILYLGHPTYAFTLVVFTLLFFSGLGSLFAGRSWMRPRAAFLALILLSLLTPWAMGQISDRLLALTTPQRVMAGALGLAPLATLMGLPFPFGLRWLTEKSPPLVAWGWAVNGCASVVAAVLAALIALSAGFQVVLWLGAAAYAMAFVALGLRKSQNPAWVPHERGRDQKAQQAPGE